MKRQKMIRNRGQYLAFMASVCALLLVAAFLSISIGAVEMDPADILEILINKIAGTELFIPTWEENLETIIWNIRFPRVLLSCIVGAGLSVCGVLMQALTKNALADPYVLGISSGASAGAVAAIVLGWFAFLGGYSTIAGAVLGAAASILLSLNMAAYRGRITSSRLVLAGIATAALFTAVTNFIIYGCNSGSDKTKTAQYWMVGSLSGADWGKVKYVAVAFAFIIVLILLFVNELDVLLLGDDVAESLGVNTGRIKRIIILAATALTGVVVSDVYKRQTTDTVKKEMMADHCTWDDEYKQITQKIRKELLHLAHVSEEEYTTVLMQGSGSFGVEAVLTSVVGEGEKLLIVANGAYGERMADIAEHAKLKMCIRDRFGQRGFWTAVKHSLCSAGLSALVTTVLAFLLAYSIQYTNIPNILKRVIHTCLLYTSRCV